MLSKYRFMEQQMLAQRQVIPQPHPSARPLSTRFLQALLAKRPDLQRSVHMVEKLVAARVSSSVGT